MVSRRLADIYEKTVATTNGTAYTAGDQIGALMEITLATEEDRGISLLKNISVVDKDKQKKAFDILFFDEQPTNAVLNDAAADIADAEMADKFIGFVNVPAANYVDLNASSVASVNNIDMILKSNKVKARSVWVLLVARDTPTYQSTSGLVVKFGIERF